MIHIKRGRLPAGARAVALREDGRIVVYVSEELSARQRLAAIREALRAAPMAGWRPEHSPVLLPALALCAGLQQAPEGRWSYRMMMMALAGAALLITATTLTTISVHGGVYQPAAAGPGRPPLTGAGPATSQSATGSGPSAGRQPGNGPSPAQPGTAPKKGKPGKTTTTSAGGPAPQASGTPAPVPTSVPNSVSTSSPSPQPSPAAAPSPSPSPSPSPAHQSGGSGSCVDVLGITLCL
jgi:hypothetical protein